MRKKLYDKQALIRCTESELKQLHEKARRANLSLSRFLVKSGLSDGKILTIKERQEINQLRFEVRKIGINLNQIAYSINLSRRGQGQPPAQSKIDEIQELIEQVLRKLLAKI